MMVLLNTGKQKIDYPCLELSSAQWYPPGIPVMGCTHPKDPKWYCRKVSTQSQHNLYSIPYPIKARSPQTQHWTITSDSARCSSRDTVSQPLLQRVWVHCMMMQDKIISRGYLMQLCPTQARIYPHWTMKGHKNFERTLKSRRKDHQ